ncbi:uncharacterized protein [Amphiura filiformis]|uniref:uncharacterized protein n=1 Tax=Amphiura filiformis TaxID=82378 RepID=UPI003B20DC82
MFEGINIVKRTQAWWLKYMSFLQHQQHLQKVFRMCGRDFRRPGSKLPGTSFDSKGVDKLSNITWNTKLLQYCNVDITHNNIHPPRFCHNCHRFMRTCEKKEACRETWISSRTSSAYNDCPS